MFTSFISWVKGLSVAGKVAACLVGLGAVGVVAMPFTPPAPPTPKSTVRAADTSNKPEISTEIVTETQPIAFPKRSIETDSLNSGTTKVTTSGADGIKTVTYNVSKANGIQINKELVKEEVTKAPVDEITSVGTYVAPVSRQNCDPNYSPCVPNVSYDLDCPDIGFSVAIVGSDPHGFDRDNDGYGCESY